MLCVAGHQKQPKQILFDIPSLPPDGVDRKVDLTSRYFCMLTCNFIVLCDHYKKVT
jgi:hypothetical protein